MEGMPGDQPTCWEESQCFLLPATHSVIDLYATHALGPLLTFLSTLPLAMISLW